MPMCGFDKQMLDGLGMFYKGLEEAVVRKAKRKNITIEDAITLELKEMEDFLKELPLLENTLNKIKLTGIVNYARTFYLGSLNQSKERSISIEEAMIYQIQETRGFLFEIDRYYYEHLEGKKEKPMFELVQWIQNGGQNAAKRI